MSEEMKMILALAESLGVILKADARDGNGTVDITDSLYARSKGAIQYDYTAEVKP